jgi:ADP-ribose pyrophosphatase YjhB (NUDIX family)
LRTSKGQGDVREDIFLIGPLIARGFQRYWRLTRGMKLAAQACVIDADNQVLLVKSAGENGWRLPGDSVQNGEALDAALRRCLRKCCGIEVEPPAELFWIYAEGHDQQTGLFVVRQWRRTGSPVRELAYVPLNVLPDTVEPRIAARIRQALEGRTPSEM